MPAPAIADRQERAAAVAVGDDAERQQRVGDARAASATNPASRSALARGRRASTGSPQPSVSARERPNTSANRPDGRGERAGDVEPRPRGDGHVVQQPRAADRRRDGEQDRRRTGTSASRAPRSARRRAAGRTRRRCRRWRRRRRTPCARSAGSVNVVASSDSAAGASMRGEHALQRARADQQLEALGGAAERRGAGEAEQADDEDPLAAEQVGDAAAEQQQAAEGQRVGGDDPLAVVVGEPEVLPAPTAARCSRSSRRARPAAGRCR